MIDKKIFLDEQGLALYDQLIKEYIKNQANTQEEAINEKLEELGNSVEANAAALEVLNGDAETEGSVAKQIKDSIDNLVDGAPEALDTLKEIADWIGEDETGTAALINRVAEAEDAIEELQENLEKESENLKAYIDEQDVAYYNAIGSIEALKISSLFPVVQVEGQSAAEAINALSEGQALKMEADQTVTGNIVIDKSCYIDANGSTFEGTVTVPAGADVIIENATFANPVVVA